jgi:MerR family Zn(II)-responsive transcriptional regulator of zntA
MRIGELAQRVGVSTDTIRFYEKQGLLDVSLYERQDNNYRVYSPAAVERLLLIKHAKRFGFTLSELRDLSNTWNYEQLTYADKQQLLHNELQQIEQRKQELEQLKRYIEAKIDHLREVHESLLETK